MPDRQSRSVDQATSALCRNSDKERAVLLMAPSSQIGLFLDFIDNRLNGNIGILKQANRSDARGSIEQALDVVLPVNAAQGKDRDPRELADLFQ